MVWLLLLALIFLFSCKGGDFSAEKGMAVGVGVSPSFVSVSISQLNLGNVNLELSVSSGDVIRHEVQFRQVRLVYRNMRGTQERVEQRPLGFSLKAGESRVVPLTVFSPADEVYVPYSYLKETNPSSFGIVYRESVLATPINLSLTCVGNLCFGTFPQDIVLGTCRVSAGNLRVEERTVPGLLEGDGTGTISGRDVHVTFSSADPPSSAVATCLSVVSSLPPVYYYLQLAYGDVVFGVDSFGIIKNPQGVAVGEVVGGAVRFYSVIGSQPAPLVASLYEGELRGGELLGYGDGKKNYTFRTLYTVVDGDSVKVIAGGVSCVVLSVDATGGVVNISCPEVIPSGTPIYVQYRLLEVLQDVEIYVESDVGSFLAGVVRLRVER